jgi:hypothetical protein
MSESEREAEPPGLTILGQCGQGLRLVSDRTASWEWETIPRREPRSARERLGPLAAWREKKVPITGRDF